MSSTGPLRKANATSAFASLATPDRFLGVMVDFFIGRIVERRQEYFDSNTSIRKLHLRAFHIGLSWVIGGTEGIEITPEAFTVFPGLFCP